MKRTLLLIVALVAFLGVEKAQADARFGINVDWNKFKNSSRGDWGVGARVVAGGGGIDSNTCFDYFFVDAGSFFKDTSDKSGLDLKFWELMENITFTFPTEAVRPYIGGGIDYSRRSFNDAFAGFFDNTKNRVGWNVLGGLKFGTGTQGFVEVRGTFYSGTEFNDRFVVSGGILF